MLWHFHSDMIGSHLHMTAPSAIRGTSIFLWFIWFVWFIWVQIICPSHLECHKQVSHLNATTTIDRILKIYPVVQWPGVSCDTAQKCCYPTLGKPAPAISIHGSWPNYKWWLPPQQLWWPTLPSQHCKSFFLTHVVSCSSNFLVIYTFQMTFSCSPLACDELWEN